MGGGKHGEAAHLPTPLFLFKVGSQKQAALPFIIITEDKSIIQCKFKRIFS